MFHANVLETRGLSPAGEGGRAGGIALLDSERLDSSTVEPCHLVWTFECKVGWVADSESAAARLAGSCSGNVAHELEVNWLLVRLSGVISGFVPDQRSCRGALCVFERGLQATLPRTASTASVMSLASY